MKDLVGDAKLDVLSDPIGKEVPTLLALGPLVFLHMEIQEDVVIQGGYSAFILKIIEESWVLEISNPDSEHVAGLAATRPAPLWSKIQGLPDRRSVVVVPAGQNNPMAIGVSL